MTELLVAMGLIVGVVAAHEIGFLAGFTEAQDCDPFDRQTALVRTSTAALVAFLVGSAFSGGRIALHKSEPLQRRQPGS
jgi:hypothetical protein